MAKKYKFVARPTDITLYSSDQVNTQKEAPSDLEESTFDLSELNLSSLVTGLSKSVRKKIKIFHFLQKRENERITLKIEHIKVLQTALQETRSLGKEIMELRADHFLTSEAIQNLIENKRIDFKHQIELKIEEHKTNLAIERNKREKEELEILDKKADLALKHANIALINAKTNEQTQMAALMKNAAEDYKNLPTGAKLSIFHDYINRYKNSTEASELEDYDFEDFLKVFKKDFFSESLKQEQAKTISQQAQADFDRHKTDKKTGKI